MGTCRGASGRQEPPPNSFGGLHRLLWVSATSVLHPAGLHLRRLRMATVSLLTGLIAAESDVGDKNLLVEIMLPAPCRLDVGLMSTPARMSKLGTMLGGILVKRFDFRASVRPLGGVSTVGVRHDGEVACNSNSQSRSAEAGLRCGVEMRVIVVSMSDPAPSDGRLGHRLVHPKASRPETLRTISTPVFCYGKADGT
jgi:hypothetical protein